MKTETDKSKRTLPLTRRAIAAWPRWRDAGPGRQRVALARFWHLHRDEERALRRFQRNLAGLASNAGSMAGEILYDGCRGDAQRLAAEALAGLVVAERAVPSVVRSLMAAVWKCGGIHVRERDVQSALREFARPSVARSRSRAAYAVLPCEPAVAGAPLTVLLPLSKPTRLTGLETELWRELHLRGLDLRRYMPWSEKESIADAIEASVGAVQRAMQRLCGKAGVSFPRSGRALPKRFPVSASEHGCSPAGRAAHGGAQRPGSRVRRGAPDPSVLERERELAGWLLFSPERVDLAGLPFTLRARVLRLAAATAVEHAQGGA